MHANSAPGAGESDREAANWNYPPDLPVSLAREEVIACLKAHQVTILCGATGSGKSTQLPKFCLEAGLGTRGLIAHTQPRRLAARALAERVAQELDSEAGELIGWQVRFKSVLSDQTRVKFLTDGVLLNELRHDRLLRKYDTIIVDEAHERSLNIDFLLGYLQRLAPQRPELKIIITSATLDAEKFSRHFGSAPVIDVPGKSHPIDLRYRDPEDLDSNEAAVNAVCEIWKQQAGDILVFLPGEREIREMAAYLTDNPRLKRFKPIDILPLFARLGSARQQKIFQPGGRRRIVLATNVAETSLTVPGILHVIDTGTARISRYNPRSKIQNLQVENIAQANADQRKGRCGRTAPGICVRLYAEDDFAARPRYTEPEIQRTNLAAVLLQMADLGLGEAEEFPFIDAPHQRYLNDARRLLNQLQAFKANGQLSRCGRQLAHLPVDPRFGRMAIAAAALGCLDEMIPIIAALSMQDPRERDFENRQKSDQAQQAFRDKSSDFIGLLKLWRASALQKRAGSSSEYRRWCQAHYLNPRRMQEWRDLVRQIRSVSHALEKPPRSSPAPTGDTSTAEPDSAAIHRALLHGLLDHIAQHDADGVFRGPRGASWRIHPESTLARRQPAWMVAAEIISTRRVLARVVAQVQPEWIEEAAAHLIQKQALEPFWDKARGEVMADEQVSLFGMILVAGRKRAYARFDPAHARQIFIEQALCAGQWGRKPLPEFLAHNRSLLRQLQIEENKLRKRGLLISDEAQLAWYAQRLPASIHNRQGLLAALQGGAPPDLRMQESDLRLLPEQNLAEAYPGQLHMGELVLPLRYVFDPGGAEDGINLDVPLASLNQLDAGTLEWLVPGMLAEKVECLIKGLPKSLRRQFVPVNASVAACCGELRFGQGDFYAQLSHWLQRRCGRPEPDATILRAVPLPPRLRMHLRVRDTQGRLLGAGRDLDQLRAQFAQTARQEFRALHDSRWEKTGISAWTEPDLPLELPVMIKLKGQLQAFPCLRDNGQSVDLVLHDDPRTAETTHTQGLLRLLLLTQKSRLKELTKNLPKRQAVQLRLAGLPKLEPELAHLLGLLEEHPFGTTDLFESLGARVICETMLSPGIRSQASFEQTIERNRSLLSSRLRELWLTLSQIADAWAAWHALKPLPADHPGQQDMSQQLTWLLAPGWLARTPRLADLVRYLQALSLRAERAAREPATDRERLDRVSPHWDRCVDALTRCAKHRQAAPQALRDYRWLIEEYRVSVFAQSVGTRQKVSEKRLEQAWQALRQELPPP